MRVLTSAWIVPVASPPIARGAVVVDDQEVVAVGPAGPLLEKYAEHRAERIELGDAVLLPAFTNAHAHLELSWMRAHRPPRGEYMAWVRAMIDRARPPSGLVAEGIAAGIAEVHGSGTILLGDVGNGADALSALPSSELHGRFFLEVIGGGGDGRGRSYEDALRRCEAWEAAAREALPRGRHGGAGAFPVSVVPHGPHSVPMPLLRRIAERARARGDYIAVHAAESAEEDELVRRGTGPFRAMLERAGTIAADWEPPRTSPIELLDEAGLLGPRTLAVHCVHVSSSDARLLARRRTTVVLCPRSNAWTGAGTAPVSALIAAGARIALGTDSLASNDDLDLLGELSALRKLAPDAPPDALVRCVTLGGAEALGYDGSFGSIEPGKRATLIVLRRRSSAPPIQEEEDRVDAEPYRTIFSGRASVTRRILRPRFQAAGGAL